MVISQQVQHAMYRQELQLIYYRVPTRLSLLQGALVRDQDISQIGFAGIWIDLIGRERQHVGGRVVAQVLSVQLLYLSVAGDDDAQAGRDPLPSLEEGLLGGALQLDAHFRRDWNGRNFVINDFSTNILYSVSLWT